MASQTRLFCLEPSKRVPQTHEIFANLNWDLRGFFNHHIYFSKYLTSKTIDYNFVGLDILISAFLESFHIFRLFFGITL
jgi:hypothetical protein